MSKATLVVPCYNEAHRLEVSAWRALALHPTLQIIFVDDGSSDGTRALLEGLIQSIPAGCARLVSTPTNSGKGQAVRAGLLYALESPSSWVGYVDSDLATPSEEVRRIIDDVLGDTYDVVMASRVRLLGHQVHRHALRHYLGRGFASLAALSLALPVYDTQCGCKFFRKTEILSQALRKPFTSAWIFDVELLGRLLYPRQGLGLSRSAFLEVPLLKWTDKPGSKVRPRDFVKAGADLCGLWWALRRPKQRVDSGYSTPDIRMPPERHPTENDAPAPRGRLAKNSALLTPPQQYKKRLIFENSRRRVQSALGKSAH